MRVSVNTHFAFMLASLLVSKGSDHSFDNLDLPDSKIRTTDLDFYPMQLGKQTAQWKRETRGRKLK